MSFMSFKNCTFEDNGIGISAPKGMSISAEGTIFRNNEKAVEFREEIQLEISSLFKNGANHRKIIALIEGLRKEGNPQPETVVRRLRKTKLSQWIANGANIATVGAAIAQLISKLNGLD
ncbi:hypothetical protein [Enterobacter hormaechei]|uniref:hypothetical protein n=1 Tax=Enterobacter hormaechei TaxID=158836 RepID=UPI0039C3E286